MISERRRILLLGRTFFRRMFESDLMPAGLPQVQLVTGAIALVAGPSLLLPIMLGRSFPLAWGRGFGFTLLMICIAFLTLVIWEGIFPDRRDARILSVLPLSTRIFVCARLGALGALLGLFVLATVLMPSLSFAAMSVGAAEPPGFVRGFAALLLTASLAESFVFFAIVAAQCALLNLFGRSVVQRLSLLLQVLMVIAVWQMPLLLPLPDAFRPPATGTVPWTSGPTAAWLPPLWFVGVYEALAGTAVGEVRAFGLRGMTAALIAMSSALLLYAASYRRLTRRALEGEPRAAPTGGVRRALRAMSARLVGGVAPQPIAHAVCAFSIRTLTRSRRHRMLGGLYLGFALALVVSSLVPIVLGGGVGALARPNIAVFAAPLVVIFFLAVGMRILFALPSEIQANWIFRLIEPSPLRAPVAGAAATMVLGAVLPAVLVTLVVGLTLWPRGLALFHATFCLVLGLLLVQLLLIRFAKVPGTCTFYPGRARFRTLWPFYLTAFTTFAYTTVGLELELVRRTPRGLAIYLAVLIVATVGAWIVRRVELASVPALRFQETDPDAIFEGFQLSESFGPPTTRPTG